MSTAVEQNISNLGFIGLNCTGLKIAVFGGGRAAYLKTAFFSKRKAVVTVFSPQISEPTAKLNPVWLQQNYQPGLINDFHLIVIATSDAMVNRQIKTECEQQCKLYLYAPDVREGIFSCPAQSETKRSFFALQCKSPNPKLAGYLKKMMAKYLLKLEKIYPLQLKFRGKIWKSK